MMSVKINILYIILMIIIVRTQSLVKLPILEDNSIKLAETAVRSTLIELFTTFKIQNAKQKPRLKQLFKMHDYFVSIMLKDCNNLEKVIGLSRVNNSENNTQHLIAIVNEALNESYKSSNINSNNTFVAKYIAKFIGKLKYLKKKIASKIKTATKTLLNHYRYSDNETLTKIVDHNSTETKDGREIEEENASNYSDFWKPSGRRIYGGSRTRIQNYPFMASIMFFKKFQCAGAIIKNDLVITSASCLQLAWNNRFFRENPAFLSVQVGSNYYDHGGENIAVQEIYFHPLYDPKTLSNNVVVVRLTRQIAFRKKHNRVKKIDIDRSPTPMILNGRITIIGWGARDDSNIIYNAFKNKLSYAELDFYPLKECQEHYTRDFVSMKNFCAGFFTKGGGACNRDAGGPAIMDDTLMGVISFGSSICGAPDSPTVFTKLGFYADWIDDIMDEEVPVSNQKTTNLPYSVKYSLIFPSTTKRINITPMGTTLEPTPLLDRPDLRLKQRQNLTPSKKRIGPNVNIPTTEAINKLSQQQLVEDETDETSIETVQQPLVISKKQNGAIVYIHTTEPINMNEDESVHMSIEIEQQTLETSKKQNGATTKIAISETANKILKQQLNKVDNDTISLENDKELMRKETVLEKPTSKESVKDIMKLVDDLDIDKFLDAMENINKEEESNESMTDIIKSEENSVPNQSFLTDTDEHGLSISGEPFEDLTLRDGHTDNWLDTLSESRLFKIMSLAIEEELKQKQKTE